MEEKYSVEIETDVGKLIWEPARHSCELLIGASSDEDVIAMRMAGFVKLKEVLEGALSSIITATLQEEHKIKEHIRIAKENAIAIETARRKGFLAM